VNMAAHRGEVLGIIGPNGAGKSTLLKALSGAIPVSTGAVSILGRDLARFRPRELARTLAYVPQSEPTLFDFTAREVVLMGRHPHSRRSSAEADAAAVAAAMVSTDTLHLGDRPITALSGGEHRRVILARAIAQQPIVMLLDEPTAHLDVTHQAEILGLLARMTRTDGLAAVAALHDLNVASEYCDRLLLIVRGRVVVEGPPHVVLANDTLASAYGARFHIAANPVTARPLVIPNVVPSAQSPGAREATIHLVCGGGTGAPAMVELSRAGYLVTAGVLNRRDTDEEASRALRLACACEEPFSPVTEARLSEAFSPWPRRPTLSSCARSRWATATSRTSTSLAGCVLQESASSCSADRPSAPGTSPTAQQPRHGVRLPLRLTS